MDMVYIFIPCFDMIRDADWFICDDLTILNNSNSNFISHSLHNELINVVHPYPALLA